MKIDALKKTKDVLIYYLRMYFANRNNYVKLLPKNFSEDVFDNVFIGDTNPEHLRKLPIIVVAGSSGKMIPCGLGDFASELYNDYGDIEGLLYGGMYTFNITVEVGTRTTLEREALADLVAIAFRFSLRRKMEKHGIIITDMSYGGEGQVQYHSDLIYTSQLNLSIWSEWYDAYRLTDITSIDVDANMTDFEEYMENYEKQWEEKKRGTSDGLS